LDRAKDYSSIKYRLAIAETVYLLVILFFFQALGFSKHLEIVISRAITADYAVIAFYCLVAGLGYYIFNFPINIYQTLILEHEFALTNQKPEDWLKDQFKSGVVSYVIALILIEAFYFIIKFAPGNWWLVVSLFWIFFSLVLAKLVPVLIIPLFFKYKKLEDENLKLRILGLAEKMKVKIVEVSEIDFSKKTLKANAAFTGWGKTKRVILADTLKDKYTLEEIEVILAHEFAHYKQKHLIKLIFVNALVTLLSFYLIFRTSSLALHFFGLRTLADISSLPVLLMYFVLFAALMQPLENYISRRLETSADKMALEVTGLKGPFISMLEKLSSQNLSDKNPSWLAKVYFFSHPPVAERIALAKKA